MTRSLLKHKKMSNIYCSKAANIVVYLLNRSPTKALKDITPKEAWSRNKPNVSHLRVFGSIIYTHIPDEQRKKLDDNSRKCILVGYGEISKAYRSLDPLTNKIYSSRDVYFDEVATVTLEDKTHSPSLPEDIIVPSWTPLPRDPQDEHQAIENDAPQDITSSDSGEILDQEVGSFKQHVTINNSRQSPAPYQRKVPKGYLKTREGSQITPDLVQEGRRTRSQTHQGLTANHNMSFQEAQKGPQWNKAMNEEMKSILNNKTWDLTDLPQHKHVIECQWLYKIKETVDGSIEKNMTRLVAKGYSQTQGVDYEETFAPVSKITTLRTMIALAAQNNWDVYQMDVKGAFLNGDIQKEVYME